MMMEKANEEGEPEPRAIVKKYLTVRNEAQKIAYKGFFRAVSYKKGQNS